MRGSSVARSDAGLTALNSGAAVAGNHLPRERGVLGISALLFIASAAATVYWCRSMSGSMAMPGGWTMSMPWIVARESYGRLVAYLSSHTRDVGSAEDALSNALAAALETWPQDGVPQNPE